MDIGGPALLCQVEIVNQLYVQNTVTELASTYHTKASIRCWHISIAVVILIGWVKIKKSIMPLPDSKQCDDRFVSHYDSGGVVICTRERELGTIVSRTGRGQRGPTYFH